MAVIVMAYTVLMGIIVMQVYAEPLFKEAVPSMESNQCSIFLAIDFIVASLLCGVLVDKLGRKVGNAFEIFKTRLLLLVLHRSGPIYDTRNEVRCRVFQS